MTYAKPEVHELGSAAEKILGTSGWGSDTGQKFPPPLAFEDIED